MKAFFHFTVPLLALITMVACAELEVSEEANDSINNGILQELSITGKDFQFEEATRSSVTIGESGASFTWDEDDVIGIFPDKGDQVSFAMDEGAGTQTATFSGGGWALKSSAKYAAYYPHVYENRDLTKIPVSYVGQTQNGNGNTDHIGAYDFMAASVTTPEKGAVAFDMQHLGALVQLTITVPEPSTLTKITLSTTSYTYITETGYVDLSATTPSITASTKSKSIEIRLTDIKTTEANEKVIIYFMMAPADFSGVFHATISLEDGTTLETDISGKKLEAGKAYALEEIDKRIFNYGTTPIKPIQDENGIYQINSAANLKWFMENPNSAHYKLTTDIIMKGRWDPIGFGGIFDGGNHIIENLDPDGYEDLRYGFFDSLYGTVKNLILKNPKINQTGDNDGYGMISGFLAATASGTIINCGIIGGSISVSSTSKAWTVGGALVGTLQSNAVVKGCYVIETKISGSNLRNGAYIGGLVGDFPSYNNNDETISITSCYTKDISIREYGGCSAGGFIGHTKGYTSTINTCYYDDSYIAIGGSYTSGNITTNTFEALSDSNFGEAIRKMNANLTDCDYIFGEDGLFVKRQ